MRILPTPRWFPPFGQRGVTETSKRKATRRERTGGFKMSFKVNHEYDEISVSISGWQSWATLLAIFSVGVLIGFAL